VILTQGERMTINFEEIRDLAKKRIAEKEVKLKPEELSEADKRNIERWILEIESYIEKYADQGKQKFIYDCSKLKKHIFHALAYEFKKKNGNFFVTTQDGCQEMVFDWTGKHEV